MVYYPLPLAESYIAMISPRGCLYGAPNEATDQVIDYITVATERAKTRIRYQRMASQAASEVPTSMQYTNENSPIDDDDPISEFTPQMWEAFDKFHFHLLHPIKLSIHDLGLRYGIRVRCSCNRGAVGELQIDDLIDEWPRVKDQARERLADEATMNTPQPLLGGSLVPKTNAEGHFVAVFRQDEGPGS